MKNRIISALLAVVLSFTMLHGGIFAAGAEESEAVITVAADVAAELPENAELFAYYVERELYGYDFSSFGTSARDKLAATDKAVYDALKTKIENVAANGGSTVFVLSDIEGLKTKWTNTELGVDSIESTEQIKKKFVEQLDFDAIVGALLDDCPLDLYWYDKTGDGGAYMSYKVEVSGYNDGMNDVWDEATVYDLTFKFSVSPDYVSSEYVVKSDVAKIAAVKDSAAAIVAECATYNDYEKLVHFKEYICGAVSYNTSAANGEYNGYGDPWQIIYVFDGDIATNVVCEGYSKAFQYLCDLAGIECISVSGTTYDGVKTGGHMWNVITLGGNNYLVDLTNCDEGTIGAPDKLFLVGGEYVYDNQYNYSIGTDTLIYICDDLSLAEENYTPPTYTVNNLGASIRPATDKYSAGLRFGAVINKVDCGINGTYAYEGASVTFGILIAPKYVVESAGYTSLEDYYTQCDTQSALDVKAKKIYRQDDEKVAFTGVLVDIPEEAYDVEICALPYSCVGGEYHLGTEMKTSYYNVALIARASDYSDEAIAAITDETKRAEAASVAEALDRIIGIVENEDNSKDWPEGWEE